MEKRSKTMPIKVRNIKCAWYYTENRLNSHVTILIPRRKNEEVTVSLKDGDKLLNTPSVELMENYKTNKSWVAVRMCMRNIDFPLWHDMRDYCKSLIKSIIIHRALDDEEFVYCSYLV